MNQLKAGSLLTYIQMALSVIISIFITPITIRILGKNEYGLYSTIASVISMLSILNLGFGAGYVKFFTQYKQNNDEINLAKLNGLYFIVFTIMGLVALAVGLFLSFNLQLVFDKGLTSEEYIIAKKMMIVFTIYLAVSFPMSVFSSIITAHEKFIFQKICNMGKTVLVPVITILVLVLGYGSIGMVFTTVAISIIIDIFNALYCFVIIKIKVKFTGVQKGLFKSIFIFSLFIAINMIVDQINNNVDKIIIGRYIGTEEVSIYNIGATLNGYIQLFALAVSSVFVPRIHKIISQNDNKEVDDLFIKVGRIQFLILGLVISGFIFFGQRFISIWAGDGFEKSYYITILLAVPSIIPYVQSLGVEIQRAKNKHQYRSIIYAIMALINLGISIVLCKKFGAIGSALGTTIAVIIANCIIMNIIYKRILGINVGLFFKNILRQFLGMLLPLGIGVVLYIFVPQENVLIYILSIILYTLIYGVAIWFLAMNNYEKNLIKDSIKKAGVILHGRIKK